MLRVRLCCLLPDNTSTLTLPTCHMSHAHNTSSCACGNYEITLVSGVSFIEWFLSSCSWEEKPGEELQLKGDKHPGGHWLHIHNRSWTLQFSHNAARTHPLTEFFLIWMGVFSKIVFWPWDRRATGQAGLLLVLCSGIYCKLYLCKPFIQLRSGAHTRDTGGRGEQSHAKNPF